MDALTPADHKTRLIDLAAVWQQARKDAAALVDEAETAFTEAKNAAEEAFLAVKHVTTGEVHVFHLVEVEDKPK